MNKNGYKNIKIRKGNTDSGFLYLIYGRNLGMTIAACHSYKLALRIAKILRTEGKVILNG